MITNASPYSFLSNCPNCYGNRIATTGLVAYWKFNSSMLDSSGNSYLIYSSTTDTYATAQTADFGNAFDFDGSKFLFTGTTTVDLEPDNNNWSLSAWFNQDNTNTMTLYSKWYANEGFELTIESAAIVIKWATFDYTFSHSGITATTWNHVAFTRDGTSIKVYLNGNLLDDQTPGTWEPSAEITQLRLAEHQATQTNRFYGMIDEVSVFNARTLTASEIALLSDRQSPCPLVSALPIPSRCYGDVITDTSLVSYWKFNDDLTDVQGNYNLSSTGSPTFVASMSNPFGKAISLNGSTQYLETASNPIEFRPTSMLTLWSMGCWFKTDSPTTVQSLFDMYKGAPDYDGFRILLNTDNFFINFNGKNCVYYVDLDAGWHHLGVTRSVYNTKQSVTLYYDGVQIGDPINVSLENELEDCGHVFYLGSEDGSIYHFSGLIDDYFIYNGRALTVDDYADIASNCPLQT